MAGTSGRYICTRRNNTNSSECKEPYVIGELIESVTWDYVMGLITNPEKFEQKLRPAQVQEAEGAQPKQKELEHIVALLKDTEKKPMKSYGQCPKQKELSP